MQFGNVAERAAVKAALLKVSVFITDWRKGGAGDKTEAMITDRHMQKVKHELSRGQSSCENVPSTSADARRHRRHSADCFVGLVPGIFCSQPRTCK